MPQDDHRLAWSGSTTGMRVVSLRSRSCIRRLSALSKSSRLAAPPLPRRPFSLRRRSLLLLRWTEIERLCPLRFLSSERSLLLGGSCWPPMPRLSSSIMELSASSSSCCFFAFSCSADFLLAASASRRSHRSSFSRSFSLRRARSSVSFCSRRTRSSEPLVGFTVTHVWPLPSSSAWAKACAASRLRLALSSSSGCGDTLTADGAAGSVRSVGSTRASSSSASSGCSTAFPSRVIFNAHSSEPRCRCCLSEKSSKLSRTTSRNLCSMPFFRPERNFRLLMML
mmetsp:Transcript_15186/g.39110  ORF Transcript_15186/g.39110 Transcript_15186/m.39110 type:complete len:282 (-) Transcript_15186:276-1121(-)